MLSLMSVRGREGMKAQAILRLDFWEAYWEQAGTLTPDDAEQFAMARRIIAAGLPAAERFRQAARDAGRQFAQGAPASQWA